MPNPITFGRALKQRTAPCLSYESFLDLAAEAAYIGVEPRTDLGSASFDGIAPAEAGGMARRHDLRLMGLSEVHPFNDWSDKRAQALHSLIDSAQASVAETIGLIPRVDGVATDDGSRQTILSVATREILPVLEERRSSP